jgi:hypothetical protein
MNTKPWLAWILAAFGTAAAGFAQTVPDKPPARGQAEAAAAEPKQIPLFSYDPGGRRDPFKDLLGGKEVRETRVIAGLADLMIDEIVLLGIVETKGKFEAVASLPEGFPLTVREGDKLVDGYVLAIRPDAVVFRKTRDKGVPLPKPRDIVKEIQSEERTHD